MARFITRYVQDLTQTGRLSSVDPNLQNIPVRLEQGRLIRKALLQSGRIVVLLSSDYSQIELRVLAHISKDEHLIKAFQEGADIHTSTAMRVFGIERPEDVTPNDRRNAKAVNFGVVYGIPTLACLIIWALAVRRPRLTLIPTLNVSQVLKTTWMKWCVRRVIRDM